MKNKFLKNLNRRLFNKFLITNIVFFNFYKDSNIYLNEKKLKKIKNKNYVWFLNEND